MSDAMLIMAVRELGSPMETFIKAERRRSAEQPKLLRGILPFPPARNP